MPVGQKWQKNLWIFFISDRALRGHHLLPRVRNTGAPSTAPLTRHNAMAFVDVIHCFITVILEMRRGRGRRRHIRRRLSVWVTPLLRMDDWLLTVPIMTDHILITCCASSNEERETRHSRSGSMSQATEGYRSGRISCRKAWTRCIQFVQSHLQARRWARLRDRLCEVRYVFLRMRESHPLKFVPSS